VTREGKRVDWGRSFLTGRAYGTDEKLSTRQGIYSFCKPTGQPAFFAWGVSRISWTGDELVLDVGCGNGLWLKRLAAAHPGVKAVGADLSEGMLRSLLDGWDRGPTPPVSITDVQALSFRDTSVDVVMLMHMLHHVPDVPSALAEARRVVPVSATWADVLEAAGTRAAGVIEAEGVFEARTAVGAFVCRP